MTSPVQDIKAFSAQAMENATVGNVSAIMAILGTTATAQRTQAGVFLRMAKCAVAEATASVGNASALNLELLGRLARSVPPARVSAVLRGTALSVSCSTQEGWLTTKPAKNIAGMKS
uniref:Uncharacterized protein n=1 Tax=Micrurus spixii TaxID=129469 RepID=A0A2D4MY58_9SAUR